MNMRGVDLNLLVILDALLDEAHVSRAALRLNLSQPAASNALQRCRQVFGDDLLERGHGRMRRTPRADALRGPLKTLLAEAGRLIDPPPVALAQATRTLRLSMADHPAEAIVRPLVAAVRAKAPGITVVLQPWQGADAARDALMSGDTDIAVSLISQDAPGLQRHLLLEETWVVAMRAGHPAAKRFDLGRWLAFDHIVVSGLGSTRGNLDGVLAERGLARRVGLVVPSFRMVPGLLLDGDMIALLPSRCAADTAGLVLYAPPVPVAGFALHMAWHERQAGDVVLRFVADALATVVAGLPAA